MKSDLLRAIIFLVLAAALFMLPQGYTDRLRLKVYGLFASTDRAVSGLDQPEAVYDSSVDPRLRLQEMTNELFQKDAEISELKRELRNFIDFKNILPTTKIIPASVIGYKPGESAPEVYLSAGVKDGVKKGDCLVQGGAYVGRVFLAGESASMAMLLDNPGCVVAGRAIKSGDTCIVRGEGYDKAQAVFYTSLSAVVPGEKIITSGLLGDTPAGLVIATVSDYPHLGREPGTLEAPVRIQAHLSSLSDVIIISGGNAVARPGAMEGKE